MRRMFALAGVVLAALAGAAAAQQAYEVKLDRPSAVGDEFEIHCKKIFTRNVTFREGEAERVMPAQNLGAELVGVERVTAMKGDDVTESVLIVKKLLGPEGNELIKAGTVLNIKRTEKEVKFIKDETGTPVDEDARDCLERFYQKITPGSLSTDDTYPPKGPRKVGESWAIDKEAAAKDAALHGMTIAPMNIKGKATLKEIKTIDGQPHLVVEYTMECGIDAISSLPPEFTMETGSLKMTHTLTTPVDPKAKGMSMNEAAAVKSTAINEKTQGRISLNGEGTTTVTVKPTKSSGNK